MRTCPHCQKPYRMHGTRSMYNSGCRCEECKKAYLAYTQEYYQKNKDKILERERSKYYRQKRLKGEA